MSASSAACCSKSAARCSNCGRIPFHLRPGLRHAVLRIVAQFQSVLRQLLGPHPHPVGLLPLRARTIGIRLEVGVAAVARDYCPAGKRRWKGRTSSSIHPPTPRLGRPGRSVGRRANCPGRPVGFGRGRPTLVPDRTAAESASVASNCETSARLTRTFSIRPIASSTSAADVASADAFRQRLDLSGQVQQRGQLAGPVAGSNGAWVRTTVLSPSPASRLSTLPAASSVSAGSMMFTKSSPPAAMMFRRSKSASEKAALPGVPAPSVAP